MTTEAWVEQATCWRCEAVVPVGETRVHRETKHGRVKGSVGFRAMCPVCDLVGGGRRFALLPTLNGDAPIENTCPNGHEYLSRPMIVR